ncbi:tetratricopeptide repeat protein [Actinomycetospora atypica]|uniref:Tetratricopeptide repeat protein n=1 Tax=Actinomycetospora atypica TaxID=1290095 RepID=A0ABV9YNE0_9PSEU
MATGDLVREHARRGVLHLASELTREPLSPASVRILVGAHLLERWAEDEEVRAALRPLFEAAVPDQRALLALGDVDVWLSDGRIARDWWTRAVAGPDPELAALGAWRVARAHLRAGRTDEARPLLEQAGRAGVGDASLRLGRLVEADGDDEAAAELFRRSGTGEGALRLAEIRLRADDAEGADRAVARLATEPQRPGEPDLQAWENGVRGEIHFRRGALDAAEVCFDRARNAPGDRGRRYELRFAQIAIAQGDAYGAHFWTSLLLNGEDAVGEEARRLVALHPDLVAAGAPQPDQPDELGAPDVGDGDDEH